ncbi:MAG: glycosyltransferase [Ignavibacteria bacterium]|nr:glycosyltransferase [Ignavibacteria bacterium]
MKIVIIGTAYPLRGGIAHYNALLANQLSKHHTVETITFKRQYPRLLFPGKTQQESGEPDHTTPAPQLLDSINPFNWILVANDIRKRKPDLLIFKYWLPFFGLCFGTIAKMAKRKTKTRVLLICDNVIPHERRPGDVTFTKYLFRHADYFIVQSDTVEKDLKAIRPKARYKKVPHPVYNMFGRAIDKQEARSILGLRAAGVVLFFGYIRAYKGLHVLLDAASKFIRTLDIHTLVVGEFYDHEEKYRKQIRGLGLDRHVTINADYVPNEKVGIYFSAADVVVLPYISATQSGIAQIAYNFDKPVIATDVGGLGEVVRDNITGFLVPPNDPDALADGILRFFAEKKEAAFIANVQKEKQKYTWEAMEAAIEQLVAYK